MDEKLKATILKIKRLSEQNPEFAQEMRKMFGFSSSTSVVSIPEKISQDVTAIREALEIRANCSVNYNFVENQRLRDQLIIDNLRMENAALNLKLTEDERLCTFCVNAFYQVENILNYYFHITFPKIEELTTTIQNYTASKENDNYQYKPSGEEKTVGDISIYHKINAFCNMFCLETLKWDLGKLRRVRNEGEHRCMVIMQEKDENNNLYQFFKNHSTNDLRIILIKLVDYVRTNVGKPFGQSISTADATITSILPSACFIKLNDEIVGLPQSLLHKVKDKKKDDIITVRHKEDGLIIDIE